MLALRRPDGSFISNPDSEAGLKAGETLIVIGTSDQLAALTQLLRDPAAPNPTR